MTPDAPRRMTLLTVAFPGTSLPEAAERTADQELAFFEKRVRPVLVERCYECHCGRARKLEGGLPKSCAGTDRPVAGLIKDLKRRGMLDDTLVFRSGELDTVHLHDMHATIRHQPGLDHERLTWRRGGRELRLTDVHGKVVHEILA